MNVSVCYLPYLPEAPSLSTVTLVQEASGNRTIAFLRNYSAHYIVPNPKPGSYHFQVTTGEYGDIASASFNVTIEGMYAAMFYADLDCAMSEVQSSVFRNSVFRTHFIPQFV